MSQVKKKTKANKVEKAQVRFTSAELEYVDHCCQKKGLTRSAWIRKQCLNENVVINPETIEYFDNLEQAVKQLAPIGNNLNQIARNINTAKASGLEFKDHFDTKLIQELNMDIQNLKMTIKNLIRTTKPEHL